jgi:hypothetical protein
MLNIVSISMVVAALLAVVVAQAFLANGQVRLSSLQHELSLEQSAHRQAELAVSTLETPSRIVSAATSQGMVHPAIVVELPYVPLSVPLPPPKGVAPASAAPLAAPPPPPTSAGSSSPSARGGGTTSASGGTNSGASAASTAARDTSSPTTTATTTP